LLAYACRFCYVVGLYTFALWKILLAYVRRSWWPLLVSALYGFQFVVLEFWRLWVFLLTLAIFAMFLCHLSGVVLGVVNGMADALGNSLVVSLLSWIFAGKSFASVQVLPALSLTNSSMTSLVGGLDNTKVRGAWEVFRFLKSISRTQAGVGCVGAVVPFCRILSNWM
jgi:hypothetical protein